MLRGTYDHALTLGLDPRELLRYAGGGCADEDRGYFEGIVCRSPWALRVVSGLVKAARNPASNAAKLLQAAQNGGLSRLKSDEDICELIESAI